MLPITALSWQSTTANDASVSREERREDDDDEAPRDGTTTSKWPRHVSRAVTSHYVDLSAPSCARVIARRECFIETLSRVSVALRGRIETRSVVSVSSVRANE